MADISDVSNRLVAILADAMYPAGTAQPSATGLPTVIYAGWPTGSQLDADLAGFSSTRGGRIHITVFPTATSKREAAYSTDWQPLTANAATVVAQINGQNVTLTGTVSTPQNVALIIDGVAYVYAVQGADTLTTIAVALAGQVPGASSAGAAITVPDGSTITAARTGGGGTVQRELRRQMRVMQITIWADTPDHRDETARVVDTALAAIDRFTLGDQTQARLLYQSDQQIDDQSKANLYRRDLMYSAEYSTTQTAGATDVVVGIQTFAAGITGITNYPVSQTLVQ